MNKRNPWPKKKYWCFTNKTLDEIADSLERDIVMSDWNYDYENVWEWYEGRDHLEREWNISRKHLNVTSLINEPVVFMAHPYPKEPSVFGSLLANALNETIYYGYAEINSDDELQLVTEKEYKA